ncbi:MAG: hypothetical protein C4531_05385 [Desulfurivibrio sp.]|jgi:hypothetical protein|nr:MAG: hypothetical protein C4531_05385 [Desulfurivibrio sp.]
MNCRQALEYRDDYIDGYLGREEKVAVREHLAGCPQCHEAFNRDVAMLQALRAMPVPAPSPGFVRRSLQQAQATRRWRLPKNLAPVVSAAMAACLVLWLVSGLPRMINQPANELPTAQVIIKINEQKIVNVVVNAPRDLLDAHVTIELPEQLEMVGFPGKTAIEWKTDLRKGKNLLSLPLVAKRTGNVELVTRIDHDNKSKLLKLAMKIHNSHAREDLHAARYMV